VGATMSCAVAPHIQTHFYVLRSAVVPALVSRYRDFQMAEVMVPVKEYFEVHLTSIIQSLDYDIASMLHYHRLSQTHFTGSCTNATFFKQSPPNRDRGDHDRERGDNNRDRHSRPDRPDRLGREKGRSGSKEGKELQDWCMVAPRETNFVRWGGESLQSKGYLCSKSLATSEQAVKLMSEELQRLGEEEPHLQISVDEATTGGVLFELYEAYSQHLSASRAKYMNSKHVESEEQVEFRRESFPEEMGNNSLVGSSVCFLVRAAKIHDVSSLGSGTLSFVQHDIASNMQTLLRQTNPHWKAFYYAVEKGPFFHRLEAIVEGFNDPRIVFLPVEAEHRNTLAHEDVHFDASNAALLQVLEHPECRFVSVTSANNAYGTAVVEGVLDRVKGREAPDIMLAPLDSRFFAKQDYVNRKELRWDQRCNGVEGMLQHNVLAYTAQPVPYPGKVDLAAAFFSTHKMRQENVRLGIEGPYRPLPACTDSENCAEGYFIRHLVRVRQWRYERLELSSLKSVIFHGNSPTLCVASGNVWFDYPSPANVGCISHKTLHLLKQKDARNAFDWPHFARSDMVCLRLSEMGHTSHANLERKTKVIHAKGKAGAGAAQRVSLRRLLMLSGGGGGGDNSNSNGTDPMDTDPFLDPSDDTPFLDPFLDPLDPLSPSRRLQMPPDFDWRAYLDLNPDLQAKGVIFKNTAVEHYLSIGQKEGRLYASMPQVDFDWKAYLELNQDVTGNRSTEAEAQAHYSSIGAAQGRPYRPILPQHASYDAAKAKLTYFLSQLSADVPLSKRTLVIYHVESPEARENSQEVELNNLRIFTSSILLHPADSPAPAFYLFNVMGENPYQKEIPRQANVGVVNWALGSSDLYVHLRLLELLQKEVSAFSAVFFSSTGVRGPLMNRHDGEWIGSFRSLLDSNQVGIVGPTVSCELTPHVQTHMFGIRTSVVPAVLKEVLKYNSITPWRSVLAHFDLEMSALVLREGLQMASLLTHIRLSQDTFQGLCQSASDFPIPISPHWSSKTWCVVEPHEIVFLRWGGEPLNEGGPSDIHSRYLCSKAVDMNEKAQGRVHDVMIDIASSQSSRFILPEAITGGILFDLVQQYSRELWLETDTAKAEATQKKAVLLSQQDDSKVCFLIRTSIGQDSTRASRSQFREMDLSSLIASLLRQVNPNWDAYFFITDSVPFENRLRRILREYGDGRLKYMSLDPRYRPAFTRVDAGYTPTDYVLNVVKDRPECRWLTISNADNVYGSETVQKVLDMSLTAPAPALPPDMLLVPLDSRNFAEHDYNKRHEGELSDRCKGISAMLKFNLLTYTKQPLPALGKVDLAAVFFQRRRFQSENIHFGNFTDSSKYPCIGCQDGYLAEYLVRNRGWTYERMPLDGLKSIVFHGPSPTWCIAGGNVWFDYPMVNKVGCFSPETVATLRRQDSPELPVYDWEDFDKIGRICLRLSKHGFLNKA